MSRWRPLPCSSRSPIRLLVSVIPGARSVAELDGNLAYLSQPIPDALWAELKHEGLIAAEAPVPAQGN